VRNAGSQTNIFPVDGGRRSKLNWRRVHVKDRLHVSICEPLEVDDDGDIFGRQRINETSHLRKMNIASESYWGVLCGANPWFGGFPYPVNPGRPKWSKVQTRGKPLVATAQATCVSAGE